MHIRIATRRSPLALWQAEFVRAQLLTAHPKLSVTLLPMSTAGDQMLDRRLAPIGGKGLFIKELESAMLRGDADMAVHSMKDMPANMPDGFAVSCLLESHDPRDAFLSVSYSNLNELPLNARVGTASLRRQSQLLATRPDLQILPLRGNVNSRVKKLQDGDYDAIILAASGLDRLDMQSHIRHRFSVDEMLPAVAQGVIGIETLDNSTLDEWLAPLNNEPAARRIRCERAFSNTLGSGCHAPVAGHAIQTGERLNFTGKVLNANGSKILSHSDSASVQHAAELGKRVAQALISQGANTLLEEVGNE